MQGSWEQCQDPLSQQWTTVPIPYSHADARDFILGFVPGAWESDKEWGFVVEAEGRYCRPHHAPQRGRPPGRDRLRVASVGARLRPHGARPADAAGLGLPREGPGHRHLAGQRRQLGVTTSWPGGWASPSRAPCASGSRTAASSATPGPAPSWPTTRASRSGAGSTRPCSRAAGVRLRAFREDDAARVVEACRDERTRAWLGDLPSPYDEEAALSFIRGRTGVRARGARPELGGRRPGDRRAARVGRALRPDRRPGVRRGRATGRIPHARGRGVMTAAVGAGAGARLRDARPAPRQGVRRPRQRRVTPRAARPTASPSTASSASAPSLADGRADAVIYDVLREEWARRT